MANGEFRIEGASWLVLLIRYSLFDIPHSLIGGRSGHRGEMFGEDFLTPNPQTGTMFEGFACPCAGSIGRNKEGPGDTAHACETMFLPCLPSG